MAQNQYVNFKHEKFIWDPADSYSLRKRNAEKCQNYQNRTTFKGAYWASQLYYITRLRDMHCKYLQWKYSGKTVFCFRLQLFNCIWIAVQSMQKLRKKVVKTTFYCNPNFAVGLMLKSSSKPVKSKLILLYFFFTEIC